MAVADLVGRFGNGLGPLLARINDDESNRIHRKNEVQFTDLPDPKPGANEVVVKVKASGICHTDYEVLKDNYGTGAFPVVPGHEYAGVVVEG